MDDEGPAERQRRHSRNTLDCLVAAPCVRITAALLHADADFDRLTTYASAVAVRAEPDLESATVAIDRITVDIARLAWLPPQLKL